MTTTPRRQELTRELLAEIVGYVISGCPYSVAFAASGIGETSMQRWLERGALETDGIYHELVVALKKAEEDCYAATLAIAEKARATRERK